MDTDHREEISKLGEELLLVEEERKAGKKVYTIDELDKILNGVIDNAKKIMKSKTVRLRCLTVLLKKGEITSSNLPEGKIYLLLIIPVLPVPTS